MNSQQTESNGTFNIPSDKILVLFDGHCNLCNGAVQFVIKRDRRDLFRFASLSWPVGQSVISQFPTFHDVDSILVFKDGKLYAKSDAALIISRNLGGAWPGLAAFRIFPKLFRDGVYDFIARNRYRWFGKKDSCMIPERDVSHLFLK